MPVLGRPAASDGRCARDDAIYAGAHLPLVHFFRLHLPSDVPQPADDGRDAGDLGDRRVGPPQFRALEPAIGAPAIRPRREHAVNELLLRLERVRFEPYRLVPEASPSEDVGSPFDQQSSRNVGRMCDFIAENFLDDIDCVDIAAAADIHPKYAMSVFKKSTGMTLNEYVNLLRLSYAQALLMKEDANVLSVAMDSGFGSLSAFNKSFRKLAGMSPSDFRKVSALR